jgi:calmodulin
VLWSSFGRLAHTPRTLAQDGGGSIDARELKDLMASVGQNPTDEELEEMIRIADADGTGDIDFAEFVTLMAHKMADEKSEETLRAAFSVFDTSGDGFINAEEMRRIMINVGEPVTLEDVEQVIRKVDKNGDGAIDYDEFTKVTPHPKHKPPPAAESPWSSLMRRRCSCPPGRRCRRRRLVRLCSPRRSSWTRHHQVLQQKNHNLDGGAGASRTLRTLVALSLLEQLEGCQNHFQHIHIHCI